MNYQVYAIIIITSILILASIRRFSIYSPLMVSSFIWLLVFLSGLLFNKVFYPLKDNAFLAWLIWYLCSGLIYYLTYPNRSTRRIKSNETRELPIDYSLIILIFIVWLAYRTWQLGSTGSEHFLLNLRLSAIKLDGFESIGIIGNIYSIVLSLFLFEHVYTRKENLKVRILLWTWMLLYAVATMGKFAVLTPIVAWVFIRGLNGLLKLKSVMKIIAITTFAMLLIHLTRAGDGDNSSIAELLALYTYSPIVALGYMDINNSTQFGPYVFRFIYAVGSSIGMHTAPAETILQYTSVPVLTNVYTGIQPFFNDFKFIGVFGGSVIYGVLFSGLYYSAAIGNPFSIALFSSLSIALIGQFFGELLLTNFSGHLQVVILLVLIWLISRKVYHDD